MDKIAWNRIKHLRQERKLSIEQIAELSGLSKSTINDLENFRKMPTQISLLCVCRAFELPAHKVFNLDYKILSNYKKRSL